MTIILNTLSCALFDVVNFPIGAGIVLDFIIFGLFYYVMMIILWVGYSYLFCTLYYVFYEWVAFTTSGLFLLSV